MAKKNTGKSTKLNSGRVGKVRGTSKDRRSFAGRETKKVISDKELLLEMSRGAKARQKESLEKLLKKKNPKTIVDCEDLFEKFVIENFVDFYQNYNEQQALANIDVKQVKPSLDLGKLNDLRKRKTRQGASMLEEVSMQVTKAAFNVFMPILAARFAIEGLQNPQIQNGLIAAASGGVANKLKGGDFSVGAAAGFSGALFADNVVPAAATRDTSNGFNPGVNFEDMFSDNPIFNYQKGRDYYNEGNFNKALDSYQKALKSDTKSSMYNYGVARAYFALAKSSKNIELLHEAKKHFIKALKYDKENVKEYNHIYHSQLGDIYSMLDDIKNSKKHIKKALKLKPDHHEYNFALSVIYFEEGEIDKSMVLIDKALESKPNIKHYKEHRLKVAQKKEEQEKGTSTSNKQKKSTTTKKEKQQSIKKNNKGKKNKKVDNITRLQEALNSGNNEEIIKELKKQGDIENESVFLELLNMGASPLYIAVKNKNDIIVDKLLEAGVDPDNYGTTNFITNTPLQKAVINNSTNLAIKLIKKGADFRKTYELGNSIIYTAIRNGNINIVRELISSGVNVNQNIDDEKLNLLNAAAYHGHLEIVNLLLQSDIDIRTINNCETTALDYALQMIIMGPQVEEISFDENNYKNIAKTLIIAGIKKVFIRAPYSSRKIYDSLVKEIKQEQGGGKTR